MRSLSTIQAETVRTEKSVESLERELRANAYQAPKGKPVQGILSFVFGLAAALLAGGIAKSTAAVHYATLFAIAALIAFILAGNSVVRFLSHKGSKAMWMSFTIIGALFDIVSGVGLLLGLNEKSLLALVKPAFAEKLGVTSNHVVSVCFYSVILFFSLIVTLGSIVRFLTENKRKKVVALKESLIQSKIDLAKKTVNKLKEEHTATTLELNDQFIAESEKKNPDLQRMQELADLGSQSAAKWVEEKLEAERIEKGKMIYATEVQKPSPNKKAMKEAAELGNANANLWMAMDGVSDCILNFSDYADDEYDPIFRGAMDYLEKADGCDNADLREVLMILSDDMMFVYGHDAKRKRSKEDNHKALGIIRKMKRTDNLNDNERVFIETTLVIMRTVADISALYENEKKSSSSNTYQNTSSYDSDYSSYRSSYEQPLTEKEKQDYLRDKMHYLYNPYVIDNDPSLTPSQKEQLKDYTRIYGD